MKYQVIFLFLSCITNICSAFPWDSYNYSVGITNATPEGKLFLEKFFIYKNAFPMGGAPRWSIGDAGTVDSFTKKPYSQITLNWKIVNDDSEKGYSKTTRMDIPEQFTEKSGREINFIFYESEVLVVYAYYSRDSKESANSVGTYTRETNYVLSGSIPYKPGDFQKYMKANPLATTEDFLKYQKKKYAK